MITLTLVLKRIVNTRLIYTLNLVKTMLDTNRHNIWTKNASKTSVYYLGQANLKLIAIALKNHTE